MKNNYPMFFIISFLVAMALLSSKVRAAAESPANATESYPMLCDAPWVLQGLQQTLIKVNKIGPGLQFQFERVQEYRPVNKQDQIGQLYCLSHLKLVESQTQRVADNLKLRYHVKVSGDLSKPGASYSVEFEPIR